ncbi:MAG TPA: GHKL domain-containing protein [Clostridiaceae bacterium]|nr:GHKL domain-containing protein [Clostridiaceae bacterium]
MKRKLNVNKTAKTVISLNIIQLVSLIGILASYYFTQHSIPLVQLSIFLAVIFISLCFDCYLILRERSDILQIDTKAETLTNSLMQVENLNNTLRAQRHDFLNHLQVVYGLIEVEEYDHVKEYIEKVYTDIQKINSVLKTAIPAVNALLSAKILHCEKLGIKIRLEITSRLDNIAVPSWELCRVLGNLIDNAAEALQESSNTDKRLVIEFGEDIKGFIFKISDNGIPIPKNSRDKIFEPGFSTKANKGIGMGLAIVKDIVKRYNGSITLNEIESYKCFTAVFPKSISDEKFDG